MAGNIQRKLTIGIHPLSYLGVNAEAPPNSVVLRNQDPTSSDWQNFIIGDLWIHTDDTVTPAIYRVWMLVSLSFQRAVWIELSGGAGSVITLTGNTGGPVSPLLGNINVVGDGTTISVAGNPGTHTLTISTVGTGVINTLTGNTGGPVSPTAGNINVVGDGTTITITGNPGTSTLTASVIGTGVVSSFLTDNGTANPIGGVIDIFATATAGSSTSFSASTNIIRLNVTDSNSNTLIGNGAGNGTLVGSQNDGLGSNVLHALTSGSLNTAIGSTSGILLTSGSNNVLVGGGSGAALTTPSGNTIVGTSGGGTITIGANNTGIGSAVWNGGGGAGLLTGSNNIAVGQAAGSAYTGAESSNILIGHVGIVGESNKLHLGTNGSGAGQVDTSFLVGNVQVNDPTTGNFAPASVGSLATTPLAITTTISDAVAIINTNANAVDNGARVRFYRNLNGAIVANGTAIMNLIAHPFDGTNYLNSANIRFFVEGAPALGSVPTGIEMLTGDGSGAVQGALELSSTQNAIFAGASTGVTLNSINTYTDVIGGVNTALFIDNAGNIGPLPSSERYKENVTEFDSSAIYKLRPISFNYKSDSTKTKDYGLLAEEVAQVFPEIVRYNKDKKPEGFNQDRLVPMLLQEIQKLNKRIEALEAHG